MGNKGGGKTQRDRSWSKLMQAIEHDLEVFTQPHPAPLLEVIDARDCGAVVVTHDDDGIRRIINRDDLT